MANILVLYPEKWTCYTKFKRKVNKIISNINDINIFFIDDSNNFIEKISIEENIKTTKKTNDLNDVSHAIIFNDGDSFSDIYQKLQEMKIPIRNIQIQITKVINIKDEENSEYLKSDLYEYIGRGSYWGNPYSMFEEGEDREEVIRKFKYDFDRDLFPNKKKDKVYELTGKVLGCFCKPNPCHGDVLAGYLNSYDDGL